MHVNRDEIPASFPDLHKEPALNHKLKSTLGLRVWGFSCAKPAWTNCPSSSIFLRRNISTVALRIIPEEVGNYTKWDMLLLSVRLGITGLWQVNRHSDVSCEERVRLDMNSILDWSTWLDLQILFRSVPAVIKMQGAH